MTFICAVTFNGHDNGEHMMASSVFKEVGAKVAQFMSYNNLINLNRNKCNNWNAFEARYFWDSTTGFGIIQVPTRDTE